jgi:hypothetical protein
MKSIMIRPYYDINVSGMSVKLPLLFLGLVKYVFSYYCSAWLRAINDIHPFKELALEFIYFLSSCLL